MNKNAKIVALVAAFALAGITLYYTLHRPAQKQTEQVEEIMDAQQAWTTLVQGNERYAQGTSIAPNQNAFAREQVAFVQKPIAVIVGCSDSRVPLSIIFDQGLGTLFEVRLAGNVVDTFALGGIEFATKVLGAKLIVVLGHQRCGAVVAAIEAANNPTAIIDEHDNLGKLVASIVPAVKIAQKTATPENLLDAAINENVKMVMRKIHDQASDELVGKIKRGEVLIMGARYDLDDGKIEVVG